MAGHYSHDGYISNNDQNYHSGTSFNRYSQVPTISPSTPGFSPGNPYDSNALGGGTQAQPYSNASSSNDRMSGMYSGHVMDPQSPPPPISPAPNYSSPTFASAALPVLLSGNGGTQYGPSSSFPPLTSSTSHDANIPRLSTMRSMSSGKFGTSSQNQHSRHSTYKHSAVAPQDDAATRQAYLSKSNHLLAFVLPFAGFLIILGGLWGFTIAMQLSKDHMIEVKSESFYKFAVRYPTLLVAIYTLISSILNAILCWCFASSVLSYARYRLNAGQSISLRGLTALQSAKDGQFALHPFGTRWVWLCLTCWAAFLATTAGFNTIISPTRRTISQDISTTELDLTSRSFANFYASIPASEYYDCSKWTSIRGLMVSPCPGGTAFTATTYAGRAQLESALLSELTYVRLGAITFTGATWGTLPYTSFNAADLNAFLNADKIVRQFGAAQNSSIAFHAQGLRARISCAELSSSPLSMTSNTPLACNPQTPVATLSPSLRMRAGYCLDEGASPGVAYDFYMRFTGPYIHTDATGASHNENLTCTIQPFVTDEWADFKSFDNSTWVAQRKAFTQTEKMVPQALVERILDNLVDMMVIFGQNSVDNLIAEQFVQLTTAYFAGDYESWPVVAQRQLEGMFAYLASTERIIAESAAAGTPALDRITQTGTLSHDAFAYAVDFPSYLLLASITFASFLGMFLLIRSASFRRVPRFDPLSITSLATASAATGHSLFLDEAALKGATPDDRFANETHVAFLRDDVTGQWGLQRILV